MRRWISEAIFEAISEAMASLRNERRLAAIIAVVVMVAGCEKAVFTDADAPGTVAGDVVLRFRHNGGDVTRAGSGMAMYCSKLNVQLFDADGQKVFSSVRTQTSDEEDFGTVSVKVAAGAYTVVAVGHSCVKSATIKSPQVVQFTATDGEKLTDTFCHCSQITVGEDSKDFTLDMYRVCAMVQFCLEDESVSNDFAYFKMEYTGGSANFNPTTSEGITKSSQSENRIRNSLNIHQCYTFPYLAESCLLKMTVSATDAEGNVIRQRVFTDVPVTRNRITTYRGEFFGDGDGEFTQSEFSFVIHADWDGEDKYTF